MQRGTGQAAAACSPQCLHCSMHAGRTLWLGMHEAVLTRGMLAC
jgi:hypothetical protein